MPDSLTRYLLVGTEQGLPGNRFGSWCRINFFFYILTFRHLHMIFHFISFSKHKTSSRRLWTSRVSFSTTCSWELQWVYPFHHHQHQQYGRAGCIIFHGQQNRGEDCIHIHGRPGCIPFRRQLYGGPGCIPFRRQLYGGQGYPFLPAPAVWTSREYLFPPPAVWTSRVYPFSPPAVCTSRVYPFLPPAVWTCRVCPFPPPAVWTCRVYCTYSMYPSPSLTDAGCMCLFPLCEVFLNAGMLAWSASCMPGTGMNKYADAGTCPVLEKGDPVRYRNSPLPEWDTDAGMPMLSPTLKLKNAERIGFIKSRTYEWMDAMADTNIGL